MQKWTFKTGDAVVCTPALAEDCTIYVGSTDCRFYALNPDGKKKGEFDTNLASSVNTSPALKNMLFAIDPNGTKK